jgi:hypothetical protein
MTRGDEDLLRRAEHVVVLLLAELETATNLTQTERAATIANLATATRDLAEMRNAMEEVETGGGDPQ